MVTWDKLTANEIHASYWAMDDLVRIIADDLVAAFLRGAPCPAFDLIDARRFQKIWRQAAGAAPIADLAGLERISSIMQKNVARLWFNTNLAEHGAYSAEDFYEAYDLGFPIERLADFTDWAITGEDGGWMISDGVERLYQGALRLAVAKSPRHQLTLIDTMISITHQRFDLARLFIQGGQFTLSEISLDRDVSFKPSPALPRAAAGRQPSFAATA